MMEGWKVGRVLVGAVVVAVGAVVAIGAVG